MKIYTDSGLTQQVVDTIDFGIVAVGESKEITYYLQNDNGTFLDQIQALVGDKEVIVVQCPKELKSLEVGTLIFRWTPTLELKAGLRTIFEIKAVELWGK